VEPRFVSIISLSTLSQLKHSIVRTSKARRAVLTRVSTIVAWHFAQGWVSTALDAKQSCGSDKDIIALRYQAEAKYSQPPITPVSHAAMLRGYTVARGSGWSRHLTLRHSPMFRFGDDTGTLASIRIWLRSSQPVP
jgi:hypothetical protein